VFTEKGVIETVKSEQLNKYQCRRKKQIEAFDDRDLIKNVTVIDPTKNYFLFEECKTCGYGSKVCVLKSRETPFETYEIKGCTLRKV